MITITIEVTGHNGESLSEIERAIECDIVDDQIVLQHPATDLGLEAINNAETFLNQNPELWAHDEDNTPDNDF